MTHYICTGTCGGVAEKPGTCQSQECPKHGEPLDVCECADGKHEGVMSVAEGESEDEE
ncbi:MAG: hypothetical protein Q8Q39_03025 [bacterium]|nr:hypothetical protein [bacterium]